MSKYILMPKRPTKAMLAGMAKATFLQDLSDLEMERRYNGLKDAVIEQRGRKVKRNRRRRRTTP